jgi:protein tyrosine phosphatase (PTP) superfamily phosphohydrolase (DUF442 family)
MTEPGEPGKPADSPAPRRRWRRRTWLVIALLAIPTGLVGREAVRVVVGNNWHVVLPGRVYRCAQQSPQALEDLTARHGIRTVINLRGCAYPEPWYVGEARATHAAGVGHEDIGLSAGRLPSRTELRRLVEVIDRAEYPLLLHCRRGADRTGVAVFIIMLLQDGVSFAEARRQLGPRYGHVRIARTSYLDDFCDLYAAWLKEGGREHTPAVFRDWLQNHYRGGHCSCVFEKMPTFAKPLPLGRPTAVPVRLRNDSGQVWHFRPTDNAGVHLGMILFDAAGKKVSYTRAGLLEADVGPGQCIELTAVLPAVHEPGSYRLFMDMEDEHQGCFFYQVGSEPFECEVRVGE